MYVLNNRQSIKWGHEKYLSNQINWGSKLVEGGIILMNDKNNKTFCKRRDLESVCVVGRRLELNLNLGLVPLIIFTCLHFVLHFYICINTQHGL